MARAEAETKNKNIKKRITEEFTRGSKTCKKTLFMSALNKLKVQFPAWKKELSSFEFLYQEGDVDIDALLILAKKNFWKKLMSCDDNAQSSFEINGIPSKTITLFPEIFSSMRIGIASMWPELEERRTVFGPDIDDISESTIRMKAQLPVRYIYQDRTEYFIESLKILSPDIKEYIKERSQLFVRQNTFPSSIQLIPLNLLFKMYGFKLKSFLNQSGNLFPIGDMFGYKAGHKNISKFLEIFE